MIIIPKFDQIRLLDIFLWQFYDFKEIFKYVQDCLMDIVGKIDNNFFRNDAKMDQNSSKK